MRIHAAKIEESIYNKQYSGKSSPAAVAFAHVLDQANALKNPGTGSDSVLQPVGVISREHPTVSDLLINNAQLSKDTWKIIHSERNTQKNYARMPPGTRVFIDRQTNELFWEAAGSAADSRPAGEAGQASRGSREHMAFARLAQETNTLSQVLPASRQYNGDGWRMLQAERNRGEVFTGRQEAEEIRIDPPSQELSTPPSLPQQMAEIPEKSPAGPAATEELPAAGQALADPFSAKLAQAVQSDLGRPYREIDCYGLVVRGLSRMGVKYTGRGGLQDQLVQMAKSRGLPANAYMTGEGLVEVSGEKVFTKSLNRVGNVEKAADRIFAEMAPLLQKGDILSFSTRTRGHTGVVSQHKEMWTFINSGYMDNRVDQTGRTKGVGEEDLAKEIKNWCKVAARSGESLVVTVGRLQEEKLVAML